MTRNGSKWDMIKINAIIKKRGLKKKDLAEKLSISPQLLSYYFTDPPTIHKSLKLALSLSTQKNKVDWRDLIR
jgi:hypothetical protein